MKKGERIVWIDHAKAFAITLVALGHIAVALTESTHDFFGVLAYFIYCFHMPFFFILSGLSYGIGQKATDTKNKVKYSVIHCFDFLWVIIIFNILSGLPLMLSTVNYRHIGLIELGIRWANRYWYIMVLCLVYMIIPWFKQINIPLLAVLLVSAFLCGVVHMGFAKFILYLFCFVLGIYLHEADITRYGIWFGTFFLTAGIMWYFWSNGVLLEDVYSKTVLGLSGSLFFINYFRTGQSKTCPSFIKKIGENTLIIYLTHGWVIRWKGWDLIVNSTPRAACLFMMCLTVCIMVGIFILLLEKVPLLKLILLKPSTILRSVCEERFENKV